MQCVEPDLIRNAAHHAGCSFANLGGRGDAAPIDLTATTGTFSNCAFRDNFVDTHTSGVIRGRTATTATTRNCTFSGNSGQGQLLHASPSSTDAPPGSELAARFFSDDASLRFCDITDGYSQVTEVEAVSRAEATMRQSLLHMQTVRCCAALLTQLHMHGHM